MSILTKVWYTSRTSCYISKVNALQINKLAKLHNPKQGLLNFVDTLTFRLRAWFLYLSNAFMLGITVNSIVINLLENKKCYLLPIDTNHYFLLEELWVVNYSAGNSACYLLDTTNLRKRFDPHREKILTLCA